MKTRAKRTRHGATQPESERTKKQVLLRLAPGMDRMLTELAKRLGKTRSDTIVEAIDALCCRYDIDAP